MPQLRSVEAIEVASPCKVSWGSMEGDGRVRFCSECEQHVYNLSEMSRSEATELIEAHEGRTCVRFFRRADGTVLTNDCPVGLRAWRRKLIFGVTSAAVLFVTLLVTGITLAWNGASRNPQQNGGGEAAPLGMLEQIWGVLFPPEPQHEIMGDICPPQLEKPAN